MTDRELLEMAAKAAGIKEPFVQDMRGWGEVRHGFSEAIYDDERGEYWNPLTDDGDALRLAVKLGIHVIPGEEGDPYAVATWWVRPERIKQDFERVLVDVDRAAATRRAIVRTAAEIGKSMP